MTSLGPDTQSYNFTHMYSFVDLRNNEKPKVCTDPNSIFGFLSKSQDFTKFLKIVQRADMEGFLNDIQANFTLFVPMDRFIEHIPMEYFENMDVGLARQILNASLLNRQLDKSLITSSPVCYYTTRNPRMRMYVTNISNVTQINNCVRVVEFNNRMNNGIVHIVNNLIVPNEDHFMN